MARLFMSATTVGGPKPRTVSQLRYRSGAFSIFAVTRAAPIVSRESRLDRHTAFIVGSGTLRIFARPDANVECGDWNTGSNRTNGSDLHLPSESTGAG